MAWRISNEVIKITQESKCERVKNIIIFTSINGLQINTKNKETYPNLVKFVVITFKGLIDCYEMCVRSLFKEKLQGLKL